MSPEEYEFLAGDELVEIIPNFNGQKVRFVFGEVGPFEPSKKITVPFWLALALRRRRRCRIVHPMWMRKEELRNAVIAEEKNGSTLSPIHRHFIEISHDFIREAPENIVEMNPLQLNINTRNVWDKRSTKLLYTNEKFLKQSAVLYGRLDNITPMEVSIWRSALALPTKKIDEMATVFRSIRGN